MIKFCKSCNGKASTFTLGQLYLRRESNNYIIITKLMSPAKVVQVSYNFGMFSYQILKKSPQNLLKT